MFHKYSFGNIFEQSFDEIWNGEKAKKFRLDVLDGKYTYCDLEKCETDGCLPEYTENPDDVSLEMPYPVFVNFTTDNSCNVRCVMCRDELVCNRKEDIERLDALIDTKFLPLLKNAKSMIPCSSGELFASKHSKKLLKKAIELYPDLKMIIYTNGLLCNEKMFKELNLFGRTEELLISVHATTKKTYEKVVRNSNFDRVIKNVKWAAEQKRKGLIDLLTLNFVVSSINYQEMPDFAQMAIDLGVRASFWEVRKWCSSKMSSDITPYAVFEKNHPEHDKFVEIINNPVFKSENIVLDDFLKNQITG